MHNFERLKYKLVQQFNDMQIQFSSSKHLHKSKEIISIETIFTRLFQGYVFQCM